MMTPDSQNDFSRDSSTQEEKFIFVGGRLVPVGVILYASHLGRNDSIQPLVDLIATTLAWAILHLTLLEFDFVFPVI
jgi:hypothetical protein